MSAIVLKMLQDSSGDSTYHPLSSLLALANEVDATIPDKINIHKSIARYIEAERKSIEVENIGEEPINFTFQIGEVSA